MLRAVAAAYQIEGGNRFKIIAYERAADSIEHLTGNAQDLWKTGDLAEVPGIGTSILGYLTELFKTGHVRHFDEVASKIPEAVFPLLRVPGIGPKKAYRLVTEIGLSDPITVLDDLEIAAADHKIARMDGFGEKSEAEILGNIQAYKKGAGKKNRMVLSEADNLATAIITHLKKIPQTRKADVLGSLRRQVSTVGDIDIAVATADGPAVVDHFLKFPHQKLIERGPTGASVLLNNNRQVDVRVADPASYGAMLQYFTGSKNHNIALRSFALQHDLSLNEYGIKPVGQVKSPYLKQVNFSRKSKIYEFTDEKDFYAALGLEWIPPEIREDNGEIQAALGGRNNNRLPRLVEISDIRGDLHIHTNYDLEPSHDLGATDLPKYLSIVRSMGYEYIGLSDHNPSVSNHTSAQISEIMRKRRLFYEQEYYSSTKGIQNMPRIFIMCEVDILADGTLGLPGEAFDYVDAVIVSVHSSFKQDSRQMTDRIIKALTAHPKVRILGHPTGRLLLSRPSVEADWSEVFRTCRKLDIALEINAHPIRLDLPDNLVFDARSRFGLKFCIDTDSHDQTGLPMMRYGVSVARRGWAQKDDIVNAMDYNKFRKWLIK